MSIGDKVMHNGEVGTVERVDTWYNSAQVQFGGILYWIPLDELTVVSS